MPLTFPRGSLPRRLALGAFVGALIVVGISLVLPADRMPPTGLWDKLQHAIAFGGLAILGVIAFPERRHLLPVAMGLMAFGAVGELVQIVVPGRSASFADALADAVGVGLVAGLTWTVGRRWCARCDRSDQLPVPTDP